MRAARLRMRDAKPHGMRRAMGEITLAEFAHVAR